MLEDRQEIRAGRLLWKRAEHQRILVEGKWGPYNLPPGVPRSDCILSRGPFYGIATTQVLNQKDLQEAFLRQGHIPSYSIMGSAGQTVWDGPLSFGSQSLVHSLYWSDPVLGICACAHVCRCLWRPEEGRFPETGVSGSYELPDMGAENRTQFLCKSNTVTVVWSLQLPSALHTATVPVVSSL